MSKPTLVPTTPKRRFLPELRSPWWSAILILSLMANLLVAGAILGRQYHGGPMGGRFAQDGSQLLPRKFFADLPHQRRREFMDLLRDRNDQFAQDRGAANPAILKFAEMLEQPDFDAAKAKLAADEVSSGPTSIAAQGETLVLDIVSKLTPDERKALAAAIRDRLAHQQGR